MLWLLLRSVIISAVRRCDVEADICSQHSAGKEACEHRMEWHEKQREALFETDGTERPMPKGQCGLREALVF